MGFLWAIGYTLQWHNSFCCLKASFPSCFSIVVESHTHIFVLFQLSPPSRFLCIEKAREHERTILIMLRIFTVLFSYLPSLLQVLPALICFDMVCFQIPEFGLIISDGSFPVKGERRKIYKLLLLGLLQITASKSPCSFVSVTLQLSDSKYQDNLT